RGARPRGRLRRLPRAAGRRAPDGEPPRGPAGRASMSGPLVLVGDSLFAEIAFEYFTHDSPYDVVAFAVERDYRNRDELFGLPVVDFETLAERYPPGEHSVYVALVYTQLNRLRARFVAAARELGYPLASYVSSR